MPENETLHSRIITALKNNKIIAILLVIVAVIIGFDQVTGSITSLSERFFGVEAEPIEPKLIEIEDIKVSSRYQFFRGHSISMLLQGELPNKLTTSVAKPPIVWQNEVYSELRELQNNYGRKLQDTVGFILVENGSKGELGDELLNIPLLPGTFHFITDYVVPWDNIKKNSKNFQTDLSDGWEIVIENSPNCDSLCQYDFVQALLRGEIIQSGISFKRKLDVNSALELLEQTQDREFYNYLTMKGCPSDFFVAKLSNNECAGGWEISLEMPYLEMQCIIIENVSEKAIKISDISGHIKGNKGIVEDRSSLGEIKKYESTIGDGVLGKNELYVIPTEILFSWEKDQHSENNARDYTPLSEKQVDALNQAIKNFTTIKVRSYYEEDEPAIEFSTSLLKSFLNRKKEDDSKQEFYYLSQNVETVKVNNKEKEIHPFDSGSTFVSHGFMGGSCPYVFNTNGISLGNVLTGRNSRNKEGVYRKVLSENQNEFEIRELENEISYIKWVRMKCVSKDGEVWYLNPKDRRLHHQSEEYVVLEKGDSVNLEFDPSKLGDINELEVFGYYEPMNVAYEAAHEKR